MTDDEAPTFELGPGNCPHQPTMGELHAPGGEWMCPECRFTWVYRPLPYQNLIPRSVKPWQPGPGAEVVTVKPGEIAEITIVDGVKCDR